MGLEAWLRLFRSRREREPVIAWESDVTLSAAERRRIARSIATFQLGECSAGEQLQRLAEAYAVHHDLPELIETTALFIREEQGHARLLARFMARQPAILAR